MKIALVIIYDIANISGEHHMCWFFPSDYVPNWKSFTKILPVTAVAWVIYSL